jgi:nitrogen fixation NifU-like protein
MSACSHHATGFNPLCGDKVDIYVDLDGDVIRDLSFEGVGCAISIASASMMTQTCKSREVAGVQSIIAKVQAGLADASADDVLPEPLAALSGVRAYPSRVKCATLPWATLAAALERDPEPTTTE